MAFANVAAYCGRLGSDPKHQPARGKYKPFYVFELAQGPKGLATWVTVRCYGKCMGVVEQLKIGKGDTILVLGQLQNGRVESFTKTGREKKHRTTYISAWLITLIQDKRPLSREDRYYAQPSVTGTKDRPF